MMQTGVKFLSVLAAVLIVLAFVLKAVIPQTQYRLGIGAYFYRLDSIAFWVLLMVGLILDVIVALKIIMRSDDV
jgi:hypothetical protein